jgi:DNA polymerase III subunit delta'
VSRDPWDEPDEVPAEGRDPWGEVVAQPAAVEALRSALAADELGHAWLVVGPPGVGQSEMTSALAAAMNCESPERAADRGCGVCAACLRCLRGTHPAVMELEPEGTQHVVGDVRGQWIPAASRTMAEGRRRVLRVVAADRMNEAAQNAFLKVLEEPPASVVWVLEAERESALLETVVSRCRRLTVTPWGPDAMRSMAARLEVPAELREALVRASLGSPQRLRDLADPDVAEARHRHLGVVDRLAEHGPGQVVPIAKELVGWARSRTSAVKEADRHELERLAEAYGVERDRGWPPGVRAALTRRFERRERQEQRRALGLVLDDLASYLRDLLVTAGGGGELVNVDHAADVERDAARLPVPAVLSGLRAVDECRAALERNGAAELHLERLLLRLALPLYARVA